MIHENRSGLHVGDEDDPRLSSRYGPHEGSVDVHIYRHERAHGHGLHRHAVACNELDSLNRPREHAHPHDLHGYDEDVHRGGNQYVRNG